MRARCSTPSKRRTERPCTDAAALVVERDVALTRHRAPVLDLALDELAELLRGHRHGIDGFRGEPLTQCGRPDGLVDLGIEPRCDFARHLRRADDPVPLHAVIEAAKAGFA